MIDDKSAGVTERKYWPGPIGEEVVSTVYQLLSVDDEFELMSTNYGVNASENHIPGLEQLNRELLAAYLEDYIREFVCLLPEIGYRPGADFDN